LHQRQPDPPPRTTRQSIVYDAVPPAVYRSFEFPGADDVGNMFQFKRDLNELYRKRQREAWCRRRRSEDRRGDAMNPLDPRALADELSAAYAARRTDLVPPSARNTAFDLAALRR
jgi:hypothetical protein